jgi:hypothetical protein
LFCSSRSPPRSRRKLGSRWKSPPSRGAAPDSTPTGGCGSSRRQSFYLEPEPPIGRFSKAFFLPLLREFIVRRKAFIEVVRFR